MILSSLSLGSHRVCCAKIRWPGMDATHLPRELMDIVMTYVGLTNLQKTGSSLAEFYRIQHKATEERENRRVFDAQTVWFEKHEPKIRIGLLVTLCVVTIVAVVWLRSYAREMIAMEDVI
jgi:cell division protein FtsL